MPVYNSEKFVSDAITSVIKQTYTHWELLVINDGSTDKSEDVINSFNDPRIRYFNQENLGVSAARNVGLAFMKGDYFCFLDADDGLTRKSIETRVQKFLSFPIINFVDGRINVWNSSFTEIIQEKPMTFEGSPFNALCQIDSKVFFGPTWMIRRNPSNQYKFIEGLTHGEDLLFYMTIAIKGGVYSTVDNVIYNYRSDNQSAMSNLNGLWEGYKFIYSYMRDNFHLGDKELVFFKKKIVSIMFKSFVAKGSFLQALKVLSQSLKL